MARQILVARKMVTIIATLLMGMALLVGVGGLNAVGSLIQRRLPFCFSDEMLSRSLRQNPALQRKMEEQERVLRNYVEGRRAQRSQQQTATSNFIVPVVVYVVHSGVSVGVGENITDQQVNSQIAALNNAFGGYGVQFCLATKQGSTPFTGSTPGIIRIQDPLTNHLTSQESQLKALSTLPGDRYLRIWVVKDIDNNSGVAGYARFPGTVPTQMEGIVMRYDVFGDVATCGCSNLLPNYDQGKILAHEVGHYFYLYHPFQGGCSGNLATNCASAGDRVCDTPQISVASTGCPLSAPSCGTASALINNEMDYTNDVCRNAFTTDQQARMLATINTLRPVLVSAQNLVYTGTQCAGGLSAAFSPASSSSCINQPLQFTAFNIAGASYAWDFGDGTNLTGGSVATHSYSSSGTYTVTLTVSTGSNSVSSTQQIFVTSCGPINNSQGNWYFGDKAGLNFTGGSPVADLNSNMSTPEGCITQSTPGGSLLFYSDGVDVYNKNHALMNPGNPLKGHKSNTQSALSVPDPNNQNRYYLFTLGPGDQGVANLWYTIVDFTSSTTGVLTNINTAVGAVSGISLTEQITAIPTCNSTGHWIIVHQYYANKFVVFSLTSSGFSTPIFANALPGIYGSLKASPDGTMLAQSTLASSSMSFAPSSAVYDFNRTTGSISLRAHLAHGSYGCSFSPDSKLLYVSEYPIGFSSANPAPIYQYDLASSNPSSTVRSVAQVPAGFGPVNLQLGPDQKIYVTGGGLHVIHFPNSMNTLSNPNACGYDAYGPDLMGRTPIWGLPNMIDALTPAQITPDFSFTISGCSKVAFVATSCAASYAWSFGDGSTSNIQNPMHAYANDGTYTVTLKINGSTVISHTVTIGISPSSASIFGPSQICPTSGGPSVFNYSTNAQPGLIYNWTVSGGAISGGSNSNNIDVVWSTLPGVVQLSVSDPTTGCSAIKSLTVTEGFITAADLYMKDTMAPDLPEDFGIEPTVSQTLYISRDIWVRTGADTVIGSTNPGPDTMMATDRYYANEHHHQDPTHVDATTPSYVYVKVRNRGCTPSAGTEKLRVYWADASTGLPWPGTNIWNEFDCASGGGIDPCPLPVIAPGQDYVVELPWVPPDPASHGGNDHFCLVARIETTPTSPFGMTNDESLNQWLWQNVAGNNNIAWKNLTVFTGSGKGKVVVRNTLRRETVLTLRFAVPQGELKDHFLLHGDITVDLGDALMKKWIRGKQRPQGFTVVGKTTIKITDPRNALLSGLLFRPGEEQTIEVRMQLKPRNNARPGTSFNWDVMQMERTGNARQSVIGGERYNLIVPKPAQKGTTKNP